MNRASTEHRAVDADAPAQHAGLAALVSLAAPWPAAAHEILRPADGSHRRRRRRVSRRVFGAVGAVFALAAGLGWAGYHHHNLIYAAWLVPCAELAMLGIGHAWNRLRFRTAPAGQFTHLVVQITTAGKEQGRVNEIIRQIRGYRLPFSYEVWVVTEPGTPIDYPRADSVLVVPGRFIAKSSHKGRALEFSRQMRDRAGLARSDVKVLFCDDDVSLTKGYIERAFAADYDICEGIVSPRTRYATRPVGHFLASHADDIRTHACLVYCSVFQGIVGRPLHVHGEGLTVTGAAEAKVTWDRPDFAAEDLVFGQHAAAAGLKWGWFREYAEGTSAWSLREYLVQRRRWLWADITGISRRGVLPWWGRLLVAGKYVIGVGGLVLSALGIWLRITGRIPSYAGALDIAKVAVISWVALFFTSGWLGAANARDTDARLLAAVTAVIMLPVSLVVTTAGFVVPLLQGRPAKFEVISKTQASERT